MEEYMEWPRGVKIIYAAGGDPLSTSHQGKGLYAVRLGSLPGLYIHMRESKINDTFNFFFFKSTYSLLIGGIRDGGIQYIHDQGAEGAGHLIPLHHNT